MAPEARIGLIDSSVGFGGGQVVGLALYSKLESIGCQPAQLRLSSNFFKNRKLLRSFGKVLFLTYRDLAIGLVTCLTMRRKERPMTYCTLLSYPRKGWRIRLIRALARQCDELLASESRIANTFSTLQPESPLVSPLVKGMALGSQALSSLYVRTYARLDWVKGLDQWPTFVERATLLRVTAKFQIAVAESIDGDVTYALSTRDSLSPWLQDGRRSADWLNWGDIFVCLSRSETTCFAICEAMARGSVVIAPRVGGVPELSPDLLLYPEGDLAEAARLCKLAELMGVEGRLALGMSLREQVLSLEGQWLDWATRRILEIQQ